MNNKRSSFFLKIILTITIVYLLFGIFLSLFQEKLIYFPNNQDFNSCDSLTEAVKQNINGTRFYYRNISEKLVIIYHGNAGSACDRTMLAKYFEGEGYSYILPEYSGYSNDIQKPNMKLILKDVEKINDFIKGTGYSNIIIFGESIGTGPASYHAYISNPNKVILISPFNKLSSEVKSIYPLISAIYPVELILTNNYNNEHWLSSYQGSILILHGDKDITISPQLSKKLYDDLSIKSKKRLIINNAGHNNMYSFDQTWQEIDLFINR